MNRLLLMFLILWTPTLHADGWWDREDREDRRERRSGRVQWDDDDDGDREGSWRDWGDGDNDFDFDLDFDGDWKKGDLWDRAKEKIADLIDPGSVDEGGGFHWMDHTGDDGKSFKIGQKGKGKDRPSYGKKGRGGKRGKGKGHKGGDYHAKANVPEPGTYIMLACCLLVVAYVRAREEEKRKT